MIHQVQTSEAEHHENAARIQFYQHLMNRLMKGGMTRDDALEITDRLERNEFLDPDKDLYRRSVIQDLEELLIHEA